MTKLAFARIYRRATVLTAGAFLKSLVRSAPCRVHTVLTDNGIQFTNAGHPRSTRETLFDRIGRLHGIEHRLTKPYHPWTNGQAERRVRTLKDATTRAFHYESIQELRRHVSDYLTAYNYAKQFKALKWKTPYETLEALYDSRRELFRTSRTDCFGLLER